MTASDDGPGRGTEQPSRPAALGLAQVSPEILLLDMREAGISLGVTEVIF